MVCKRNFASVKPESGHDLRSKDDKLKIIKDKCEGCIHFDKQDGTESHRCKESGCQNISLWRRLKNRRWQCPKGVWNDGGTKPKWTSNRMLIRDTMRLVDMLPHTIDAVVGVPRSGMMAAAFLSTTLHLPLYTFRQDGTFDLCSSHGRSTSFRGEPKHFLILDDTVCRGGTMRSIDRAMEGRGIKYTKGCVYLSPGNTEGTVDVYAKDLIDPHILEWNLFNTPFVRSTGFDIDGILCPDVPREMDDDGEKYSKCLQEMPVRYAIRRFKAGALVTARLEKYREVTETWLKINGILYKELVMGPWKNNKERSVKGVVADWKAGVYKARKKLWLFVESDDCLASNMARLSRKSVACPATERIY